MAAFEANRDAWLVPSRRRMSLIDVRLTNLLGENVTTPSREEQRVAKENARSIIQTAQSELASGVAFADVARRHSHGLHAEDGGSWGWVSPDGVRERFKSAVDELYRLEEGQVSDPIETPDGFLLVFCDGIDPGFEPTFEAIQPELQISINYPLHGSFDPPALNLAGIIDPGSTPCARNDKLQIFIDVVIDI